MRKVSLALAVVSLIFPVLANAAVVNINTATLAELDTLPGIGPSKAAAIVEYRTAHGPFSRTEDLVQVKGIGPATYESLKAFVTISEPSTVSAVAPTMQPKAIPTSSYTKQTVEAAVARISEPAHAQDPVDAPEVTSQLAASGAVSQTSSGLLHSVWTMVFLGVLLVGGGVLLIL